MYAQQCGYGKSWGNPIRNAVTLGEVLREAGYRTLWSGKHHGLENPIYLGFDRYYGLKSGGCNYFNPGNQRSGEAHPARKGKPGNKRTRPWCIDSFMYKPYTPEARDFYTTDYFTNYALDWLEEYKDEDKPFFLYLAYTAPHDPLMAWPEDIEKYKDRYDAGYEKIRRQRYQKQLEIGLIDSTFKLSDPAYRDWSSLSVQEKMDEARKMEVYAAMIDRLDQNIGRILKKLEENGDDQNTLILFVSDNGASAEVVNLVDDFGEIGTLTRWTSLGQDWANVSNTPFRYYKNYSYEGGINTPLIAYWPGVIEPDRISKFPGHFIDFMPTFIEITEAQYPTTYNGEKIIPFQGESLLSVFLGQKENRMGALYWKWQDGKALWKNGWKIVKEELDNPWDLYNLENDPTETVNLSGEYPLKVNELDSLFNLWYAPFNQ